MYCRIRWYKVLRPHPSTWAIGMTGAPSAWRAQGHKHVKTALVLMFVIAFVECLECPQTMSCDQIYLVF